MHGVDARPSDALNLALRMRAPIFVAPELFDHARVSFLTQEDSPPERGYVVCRADGRQMRGPELYPLLDDGIGRTGMSRAYPPKRPRGPTSPSVPYRGRSKAFLRWGTDTSHGDRTLTNPRTIVRSLLPGGPSHEPA